MNQISFAVISTFISAKLAAKNREARLIALSPIRVTQKTRDEIQEHFGGRILHFFKNIIPCKNQPYQEICTVYTPMITNTVSARTR